jgi:RNA polymerase sigma factor (sigma-70 family)
VTVKLTPEQQQLALNYEGFACQLAIEHQNWPSADRPSLDDLRAEARLELCLAARDWDPDRASFPVYLAQRLARRFQRADEAHKYPVHVPDRHHARVTALRRARAAGATTPQLAAKRTGMNVATVRQLWPLLGNPRANLEDALDVADETLAVEESALLAVELSQLRDAVAALPPALRAVIEARLGYLTGAEMTTEEIAEQLRLKPETVAVRQQAALEALREAFRVSDGTDL